MERVRVNDYITEANFHFGNRSYAESLSYFKKAASLDKKNKHLLNNIGVCYSKLGYMRKAIKYFEDAIIIDKEFTEAYSNIGNALRIAGFPKSAEKYLCKAITLNPEHEGAYINLSIVQEDLDKLTDAQTSLERALEINITSSSHLSNLYYIKRRMCDWANINSIERKVDQATKRDIARNAKSGETPFINIFRTSNMLVNRKVAQSWSDSYRTEQYLHKNTQRKKIIIGYFSENFRNHPVGHCVKDIFGHHDKRKFQVNVYSYGENDGTIYRTDVEKNADKFIDVQDWGDKQISDQIYHDNVDILIDLGGYTRGNRFKILASRPAPIQISYLSFPGTTGADYIDYLITDEIVNPPYDQKYYSEVFQYMPDYYQANSVIKVSPKKYSKEDFGLPKNSFVMACFNRSMKLDPCVFKTWVSVLKKLPNSILWIYEDNKVSRKNIIKYVTENGLTKNRLRFYKKHPIEEHLAHIKLADVILDTSIYSGGASTANAVRANVPVVTLEGKHYLSRMSSSLLSAIGMQELICSDLQEYENKIIELAKDKTYPLSVKKRINENKAIIFDIETFTRNLERIYINVSKKNADKKRDRIEELISKSEDLILKGDLAKCSEILDKILLVDPNNQNALVALSKLYNALRHICDWRNTELYEQNLKNLTTEQPFNNLVRVESMEQNFINTKNYLIKQRFKASKYKHQRKIKKRIRVGYVSNGLRDFPTGHNIAPIIKTHDKNKFDIYSYSWGKSDGSAWEKEIRANSNFIDIQKLSDKKAAEKIYNDSVDILVDLKGHIKDNRMRIFAYKPSSVQISFLGYPGTTGATFIDYLIADKHIIKKPEEKYFNEQILYIPNTYRPMFSSTLKVKPKNNIKLESEKFIFASFNHSYKITPEIFASWMKILKSVPNSVLWQIENNSVFKYNLQQVAKTHDISLKRIIFVPNLPKAEHLLRLKKVDLVLDTYPVGGHTTTVDCISIGVPVLTIYGKHFASRVSASCLLSIGLGQLVAKNLTDYMKKAIELSKPARLKPVKILLNRELNSSTIFDVSNYTKELENLYTQCVKQYNRK